jgi:hypothetical protein
MPYLKNSILNFDTRPINGYVADDYFTLNFEKINAYVLSCPKDWFDWYQLQDNDKLEKVSLDIYGDADYWDILLVINKKNALFDMPYDYDTLLNMADYKTANYEKEINKNKKLPDVTRAAMLKAYREKAIADNETFRIIKIVRPSKIQAFIQGGYELGYFK